MIRLNYGELPPKSVFSAQWNESLLCTGYRITHGSPSGEDTCRPLEGVYSEKELWYELNRLVVLGTDSALDWASSILSTLGFEWV